MKIKKEIYKQEILTTIEEISEELLKLADAERNDAATFNTLTTILLTLKTLNN